MQERRTLQIAGIVICVEGELPFEISEKCQPFLCSQQEADVHIYLKAEGNFDPSGYTATSEETTFTVMENDRDVVRIRYANSSKRTMLWRLQYRKGEGHHYTAWIAPEWESNLQRLNPLFFFELSDFLIGYQAMILHSSVIRLQGKGIVFTAPSGTGKSTQAELWEKYRGAEIINGDRTIIRRLDSYCCYGSPYAGSSGIYKNESAELRAIVVLRQAEKNVIQRLQPKEALLCLLSEMSISEWDRSVLELQMDWLIQLLERIPVYRLDCLPNKEAVDVLSKELGDQFAEG